MITVRKIALAATVLASVLALGCEGAGAPDPEADHVHGGGEAITIWTERLELFFEHPPLIAGVAGQTWAVHLTDLSDFKPLSEGSLTLRFAGPDGGSYTEVAEAPARPGIYTPAPALPTAGMYDLVMELRSPRVDEDIFVGPIQVFPSENDLPHLPEEEAVGITFLKEQQWPIDFATASAGSRVVRAAVRATGEIVEAPNRLAAISAPVEGILRWDENRDAPAEGSWVTQGDPILRLSPVGGSDTYAVLRSRWELLEREVARAERLVAAEAVPHRRLEEARLESAAVGAQLDALDAATDEGYTLIVRSPLSGFVTTRSFTVGQRVAAGEPLLMILDPSRLWIRFHVPATRAHELDQVTGATFSPEGSDQVFRTESLVTVAAALDPVRRTVAVTLAADNPNGELKPGMLVTGRVLLSEPEPTLAVPAEAVVDEDGLLVAYVQIGGETFERRAVSVGTTDGQWTTVLTGIRPGEHVVTRGAYQIRLSSLNTSEISDHGHVH
jgi:RND family efflux transporter MFP subunit